MDTPYPFRVYGRATLDAEAWDEQQARIKAYDAGQAYIPGDGTVSSGARDKPDRELKITDLSVPKAREIIRKALTLDFLDKLQAQEEANEEYSGGRAGVLAAIRKQRIKIEKSFQ